MAGQHSESQLTESFEYMLFEGDPDHLKPVTLDPNAISPWINPNMLKLEHRIGRGPFGDVWLAVHHDRTEDYDRYHEVAVKMLFPIKDDHMQLFITKFNDLFFKCRGLQNVCFLHGISILNGRACLVMKFYEGSIGDKAALVKGGSLSFTDVLRYGIELAQGITELHSRGILVLNLKPCNFLLNENDHAILGDFGIPFLLLGISLPCSDLVQRIGTPNYMAPEQWKPSIRGPVSFETDSWGFACSIVEMLTGYQPWFGKSAAEIYNLVVEKQVMPSIPGGLPPELENVLYGCFQHDFRNRPLMTDILDSFKRCRDLYKDDRKVLVDKKSYTDWSILKDILQLGDTVRSRKTKNSYMAIPEGTVVGIESKGGGREGFILVRVHRFHNPLRVHASAVERVTHGFAAGDWVRVKEEGEVKHSLVGILHKIGRATAAAAAFAGMETLWEGDHSELQMAASCCVGQFLRIKSNISSPRFEWPVNRGAWVTGRVAQILPNGCLVVRFPGRISFGDAPRFLADPAEVEAVGFASCDGVVNKYWHLEDYHWIVRPLVVALGLFAVLKLGVLAGNRMGGPRKKRGVNFLQQDEPPRRQQEQQNQQDGQNVSNSAWFPPSVTNMLFGECAPPSR